MGDAKPSRWRGMLAPIGKPTGDGRMFAPESLSSRDLPLPLRFQRQDGGGHGGAVVVGRILRIDFRDDQAFAEGDWLDEKFTPEVAEAKEWTRQRVVGPSVDLDDAVMELVPVDQQAAVECGCDDAAQLAAEQPMIKLVTKGRISGATLVQIPAFAECAALELSDDHDWEDDLITASLAAGDAVTILGEDDNRNDTGYFVTYSGNKEWVTVVRDNGDVEQIHAARIEAAPVEEADAWAQALLSAAAPVAPPAAWFDDPELDGPTPLRVTDDGRVFGHLATWDTCHVGLPGCTTAPRSKTAYAFFHTGEVVTADGTTLEVGKITLGTGHADANAGFRAAADHYDHTGSCVAIVRAGEDAHGVWVAGALTAGCDTDRIVELRRSPLSGDWRRIGSNLELVAALAVNVPGFPVPRARVASGQPTSLVAAGALAEPASQAETVEQAFNRLMRRRKKFQKSMYELEQAAADAAEIRAERLAANLLLLDPEYEEFRWLEHLHPRGAGGKFTERVNRAIDRRQARLGEREAARRRAASIKQAGKIRAEADRRGLADNEVDARGPLERLMDQHIARIGDREADRRAARARKERQRNR